MLPCCPMNRHCTRRKTQITKKRVSLIMSSAWSHYFLWNRFLIYQLQTSHMTNMMTSSPTCFDRELSMIQVELHTRYGAWHFSAVVKSLQQYLLKSFLTQVLKFQPRLLLCDNLLLQSLFSRDWMFSILQAISANILWWTHFWVQFIGNS